MSRVVLYLQSKQLRITSLPFFNISSFSSSLNISKNLFTKSDYELSKVLTNQLYKNNLISYKIAAGLNGETTIKVKDPNKNVSNMMKELFNKNIKCK